MKNIGIIYYGSDKALVLKQAFDTILNYLKNDSLDESALSKYVLANTYPNFFHVTKSSDENEISIERSREIINFLSQKPTLKGKRAVLIENFEYMSRNAANSILKILEEPPQDSVIILTTTRFSSILPTIRSRCLKFKVKNDNSANVDNSSSSLEFAKLSLTDLDSSTIELFDKFINGGCSSYTAFAKENSEKFLEFLKAAIAFCAYHVFAGNLQYSRKLISLQELYKLSEKTYPDKQSVIISVCEILRS